MSIIDWAVSVKEDLLKLQSDTGIPALFAISQMCHESSYNGGLSELAAKCQNYAGIKWVGGWQLDYGATPVVYGTWENIDGQNVSLDDTFAKFPDWQTWLKAYAHLLSFDRYKPALAYAADPMLYALHVWRGGWATDPAYLAGIGGWMSKLWVHYSDTLPTRPENMTAVPVKTEGGRLLCAGKLENGSTIVQLRPLAEAMGLKVRWDNGTAFVEFPGAKV